MTFCGTGLSKVAEASKQLVADSAQKGAEAVIGWSSTRHAQHVFLLEACSNLKHDLIKEITTKPPYATGRHDAGVTRQQQIVVLQEVCWCPH